jgi:hypothetical protein
LTGLDWASIDGWKFLKIYFNKRKCVLKQIKFNFHVYKRFKKFLKILLQLEKIEKNASVFKKLSQNYKIF